MSVDDGVRVCVCNGTEHWLNDMFLHHSIVKLPNPLNKCRKKYRRFDTDYWYPLFHLSIYLLWMCKCGFKKIAAVHRALSFSMQTSFATEFTMLLVKIVIKNWYFKSKIHSCRHQQWRRKRERKEILWKYVLINLCKTVDTSAVLKIITLDDFLVEENASERQKMYINEGIDGWSMNEMESGNGQGEDEVSNKNHFCILNNQMSRTWDTL